MSRKIRQRTTRRLSWPRSRKKRSRRCRWFESWLSEKRNFNHNKGHPWKPLRLLQTSWTYKKVEILSQVLEKSANQSGQMDDMCWLVLLEEVQSLLLVTWRELNFDLNTRLSDRYHQPALHLRQVNILGRKENELFIVPLFLLRNASDGRADQTSAACYQNDLLLLTHFHIPVLGPYDLSIEF